MPQSDYPPNNTKRKCPHETHHYVQLRFAFKRKKNIAYKLFQTSILDLCLSLKKREILVWCLCSLQLFILTPINTQSFELKAGLVWIWGSAPVLSTTFPQDRCKFLSDLATWILPKTENLRLSMLQTLQKCLDLDLSSWSKSSSCGWVAFPRLTWFMKLK